MIVYEVLVAPVFKVIVLALVALSSNIDLTSGELLQVGATPTPPDTNTLPISTPASLAREVVVSAYKISPTV